MSQPYFHLRPNKYVDRTLFVELLHVLDPHVDLSTYYYIGFGSYSFDDFKSIYKRTAIKQFISIEQNATIVARAEFNLPNNCTTIVNDTSTNYLAGSLPQAGKVIWLDYMAPNELASQFNDLNTLCSSLAAGDIVRITLNANPTSLGGRESDNDSELYTRRLNTLRQRINDYLALDLDASRLTKSGYPFVLLESLKTLLVNSFRHTRYDSRYILPLFSSIYEDGQQMLTFTFLVLDDESDEQQYRICFEKLPYINLEWACPQYIALPNLTVKEKLALEAKLPNSTADELKKDFAFLFSNDETVVDIENYLKLFKYYPNFHDVNF